MKAGQNVPYHEHGVGAVALIALCTEAEAILSVAACQLIKNPHRLLEAVSNANVVTVLALVVRVGVRLAVDFQPAHDDALRAVSGPGRRYRSIGVVKIPHDS